MPEPTEEFSFIQSFGGFNYNDGLHGMVKVIEDTPLGRSSTATAAAHNGSTSGDGTLTERRVEARGIVTAYSQKYLRQKRDAFMRYHQPGRVQKLVIYGNRWLWAAVDGNIAPFKFQDKRQWEWEASFICADPYYYAASPRTNVLTYAANQTKQTVITTVEVGGMAHATPIMEFTVSNITTPGISYIQLKNLSAYLKRGTQSAQELLFLPPVTGKYTMYWGPNPTTDPDKNQMYRHKMVHETQGSMVNKWRRDPGEITLSPDFDNTLSLASSGITLSAAPVLNWLPRYA